MAAESSTEGPLLYHEQQESAICGVHALNTLLQGPYFTEVDLSQIALELDRNEREMMAESGLDSSDYLKFMAEESGNVAPDGNFSIQVLSKALEVWGLSVVHLDSPEGAAMGDTDQAAFLCNLQQHWFTIRKVGADWYNMNSLYPAPTHLSQFYLAAYLGSLKDGGYTIFAVQGDLPRSVASEFSGSGQGRWMTAHQADAINAEAKRKEAQSTPKSNPAEWPVLANAPDDDIAAAIAMSLRDAAGPAASGGSSHWGSAVGGGANLHWDGADSHSGADEDPELAAAIAASLSESFEGQKRKMEVGGGVGSWGGTGQRLRGSGKVQEVSGRPESPQPGVRETEPSIAGDVTENRTGKKRTEISQDALSRQIAAARAKVEARAQGSGGPGVSGAGESADVSSKAADVTSKAADVTSKAADVTSNPAGVTSKAGEVGVEGAGAKSGASASRGTELGGLELAFRLLDGRRVSRRFPPGATVDDALAFLRSEGVDTAKTALTEGGGGKLSLDNPRLTLEAAGLQDKSLLVVKPS